MTETVRRLSYPMLKDQTGHWNPQRLRKNQTNNLNEWSVLGKEHKDVHADICLGTHPEGVRT
jgi:hypothetical protein